MTYKQYFINKYKRYMAKNGIFFAFIKTIVFVINKLICLFLINFISKKNKTDKSLDKNILFIEPAKQGFGDLLFQTPLFKSWSENGYIVNILLSTKQHGDIIKNNPYVNEVFIWRFKDLIKILFTNYGSIFCLCRNFIRESILLMAKISSNKILPDLDLALWEKSFLNHPNTIAWQIIINKIDPNLRSEGIPQIFFSESEKKYISENKKGQIEIIAGVEDRFKQIPALINFLSQTPNELLSKIILIGKGANNNINKPPITNLINKLTYRETILEIASANFIFGPEGSLVHIASVLDIKTVIYDSKKIFMKNAHPALLDKGNLFFINSEREFKNVIDAMRLSSVTH